MKTTPLNDHLIQLTRYGFVNAYLVRESDGFTLVDTTMPRTGAALIAAATAAGAPIRRIALTHGHGDHVGSVDELKRTLDGGVPVLMPELDARIHAGDNVVEGKLTGSWPKLITVPDVRLAAGDRVGSLEVDPQPRPLARPCRVPRHPRPHGDRRRCVHVLRQGGSDRPLLPALPAGGDGHV